LWGVRLLGGIRAQREDGKEDRAQRFQQPFLHLRAQLSCRQGSADIHGCPVGCVTLTLGRIGCIVARTGSPIPTRLNQKGCVG
jgi:hypothetical protein